MGLHDLAAALRRLDGRGYRDYKEIKGRYDAGEFTLAVDYVQGDPFAEPSRVRAFVAPAAGAFPEWARSTALRRTATADFLTRALHRELTRASSHRGSGKSGELRILRPGQEVLPRACMHMDADGSVEARFRAGLPARGRNILGAEAAELLCEDVVAAVRATLLFPALDAAALRRHVETVEDARALRDQLERRGLVAFVADGARLPRRSGVDDAPMDAAAAVPFESPDSLAVTLEAPNAGALRGMGVPRGVTLIVGGGFHGKSTLLRAIERGVYDHLPGDGRERVVTVVAAVKVRAEDGRSVPGVDISNFIGELPSGADTRHFRTENASGSTSQAAAIAEALEVGCTCLLLDEDTSATNFMIRDARMQALIADEHEPITPFIDRARQLSAGEGISTVVVVGGSGDYFDVADTVVAMRAYRPEEVTERAREVAQELPTKRRPEGGSWRAVAPRTLDADSVDPSKGRHDVHVRARTEERVLFGAEEVELSAVEQLVETAQTRAMALALAWARREGALGRGRSVADGLGEVAAVLERDGLDTFQPEPTGELAAFRVYELAALLGRIRGARTNPLE